MTAEMPGNIRSVYFIGIAGIGMSALARYFKRQGKSVSGYDVDRSALAKELEQEGITVHYTEDESILPETPDLVVYTPAVPESHKGLRHYRNLAIPVVKRSKVLGWISEKQKCIAVAGTHGKTTTSALITVVLRKCGVDVSAFLGGLVPDLGGNFVHGDSEWLVAEADEYDRSFLALSPEIAVITAMDPDHLDIYGSHREMISGYVGFLQKVHRGGVIILHEDVRRKLGAPVLAEVIARDIRVITFGKDADYRLTEVHPEGKGVKFLLIAPDGLSKTVIVGMPGTHNAMNAVVSLMICDVLKLDTRAGLEALAGFGGIKRRFEVVYADDKRIVIDDYAHHPAELVAAINAARLQYPEKRITGVFQPHLYSRTKDFYHEFADALADLDTVILVELYPARERPIEGVSSKLIFDEIKNDNKYLTTKKELISLLVSLDPGVLLLLGAGDLDRRVPEIIEKLKEI